MWTEDCRAGMDEHYCIWAEDHDGPHTCSCGEEF